LLNEIGGVEVLVTSASHVQNESLIEPCAYKSGIAATNTKNPYVCCK